MIAVQVQLIRLCVTVIPISGQPAVQVQWMVAPPPMPRVPPGLEYLTQIDQLLIHQQVEALEGECSSVGYMSCHCY